MAGGGGFCDHRPTTVARGQAMRRCWKSGRCAGPAGLRAGCALLLTVSMGGHALAGEQDTAADVRSVASAQQFLQQVLPGNRYLSTPMNEALAAARRERLQAQFQPLPVIIEAEPLARCVTRLRADASATTLVLRNPHDSYDQSQASAAELLGSEWIDNPDGMQFGSIRQLGQRGNQVFMRLAGNEQDAVLHLEGTEIASRVLQALEYLREQCDSTRATGF